MKKFYIVYLFVWIYAVIFASCSSVPKNPGDIYILRPQVENGLETANREAAKGNFVNALLLLTGYKRSAILTDDMSLIVRVTLSRGNVFFSLGRFDEAFAEWDYALKEAVLSGNAELISISKIFYARGNLLSGKSSAQAVYDEITRESANIKNRLYTAFSWQVRGLALRELGRWREAEDAVRQSLSIHEKDRHLENASYDWYIIASIRSLSGSLAGSLQALETSIEIDRRIENSWGLATGWRAKGDVLRKDGREAEAIEAYGRAKTIFEQMENFQEALETEKKINN
ncbi:MAG: hypothetical protein FWC21_02350 [Treponema sp.]|nr:hypothetical protein [Treponema sp.]